MVAALVSTAAQTFRYKNPTALFLGLEELRKRGLTPRGLLFLALDPRGEPHIAVAEDMDAVTRLRVGDKLSLTPPWQGRYLHFDAIHRLPAETVLWNGDRRLADPGSAQEVAESVAEWLRGSSARNLFLGCTPHQPGSWWSQGSRTAVTALHARGFVDTVVSAVGLLARRIGEPGLYHLSWQMLAQAGALEGWIPIYTSPLGNILLVERRVLGYRLVLTCQQGLIEIDVSGAPEEVRETARLEGVDGFGVVGRVDGGGFAVTRGRVEAWGLADVLPAELVGSPHESVRDLQRLLGGIGGPSARPGPGRQN
jgi:hypothetical protein